MVKSLQPFYYDDLRRQNLLPFENYGHVAASGSNSGYSSRSLRRIIMMEWIISKQTIE